MIVRILTAIIYGSIRTTDYIGWDKMKDFPGNSKIGAIAFVIENKAYVGLGRSQLNGTVYLCFGHNAHEYSRDVYKFNPEEFRFIPLNTLLPDRYPGITRSYASF
mgnify:CR=1 FL=1